MKSRLLLVLLWAARVAVGVLAAAALLVGACGWPFAATTTFRWNQVAGASKMEVVAWVKRPVFVACDEGSCLDRYDTIAGFNVFTPADATSATWTDHPLNAGDVLFFLVHSYSNDTCRDDGPVVAN